MLPRAEEKPFEQSQLIVQLLQPCSIRNIQHMLYTGRMT